MLSTKTNEKGNYSLDLGNAREESSGKYFTYAKDSDKLKIEILAGQLGQANILLRTNQAQPVKDIVLGNGELVDLTTESLTAGQKESQETRSKSQTPTPEAERILSAPVSKEEISSEQDKIKPKIIIDPNLVLKPGEVIQGTASPGASLTITIFSEPIVLNVRADENGKWQITIPLELNAGNHSIKVSDRNGIDQTGFVLAAQTPPTSSSPSAKPSVTRGVATLPSAGKTELTLLLLVLGASLTFFSLVF